MAGYSKSHKILIVVGARPNFIKASLFKNLAPKYKLEIKVVHTGQHFDKKMSSQILEEIGLEVDFFLDVGQQSANSQIAGIMLKLEELILHTYIPDVMLVVGDVNSTLAGALTANKLGITLGHVEAGLRSFDNTMPEEINRILVDRLSKYHFITEESAERNLKNEGLSQNIIFVGNTMIDTLVSKRDAIEKSSILTELDLAETRFALFTMHRPINVDNLEGLNFLLNKLQVLSKQIKVVFPIHPRTKQKMKEFNLSKKLNSIKNLVITEPLGYIDFQKLLTGSAIIFTDSGGIQEEASFLNIPCVTYRSTTERPVTLEIGSNILLDIRDNHEKNIDKIIRRSEGNSIKIPFWDGQATQRVLSFLKNELL